MLRLLPPSVRLHRLAFRVAVTVGLGVAVTAVAVAWLPLGPVVGALVVVVTAWTVAYVAVSRQVADRLELARRTLREARKRRFEALAGLPGPRSRDELDALLHQVGRAGRTLQGEIERLERVESYRREFLGDVSHELRTPIFAVAGFAETLLDGALEDERVRRRFVEKIADNARRLEALTRDLSDISKLETGQLRVDHSAFNLRALVGEVGDALERAAAEHDVTLAVRVPPDLPLVLGDRDRIRQVLTNLAENGLKYNRPGGRVEVTARRRPSGDVRVTVVDDGIGIPREALGRLTERFFRVDKSRSRAEGGTGLGLAIVKHLLDAHGQQLEVESRLGYGSTFAFTLPAAPERAPAGLASREAPAGAPRT